MDTLIKYVCIGGPPLITLFETIVTYPVQLVMSLYAFFFQLPILPELALSAANYSIFKIVMPEESYDDLEAYKYTFSKPLALTSGLNYYRAALRILFADSLPRPLSFAPGLFLLGERDIFISQQCGINAQKKYDNLDFQIIHGADHFAIQSSPDKTNQIIREFIEKETH